MRFALEPRTALHLEMGDGVIRLCVLGSASLQGADGTSIDAVLAQPKRFALLTYLAVDAPGGFVRRDSLLAMFWPESDDKRARGALKGAVYYLRQALGEGAIVGRGDGELGIAIGAIWCDAVAAKHAFANAHLEEGLTLFAGDLLAGLFVPEAPGFERWVEQERAHIRERAARAAESLATAAVADSRPVDALRWATRAAALKPYDEGAHRRLLELLDAAGARADAVREHQSFVARLRADFELEPSSETEAIVARIRHAAAREPARSSAAVSAQSTIESPPAAEPEPTIVLGADPIAGGPSGTQRPAPRRRLSRRAATLIVAGAVGGFAALLWAGRPSIARETTPALRSAMAEGRQAFASGRFTDAVSAFERAIATDSGFAPAYLGLSQAMNWTGQTFLAWTAVEKAEHLRERLSPADQRTLAMWRRFLREDPAGAESVYNAMPAQAQQDPDIQSVLGELRFHWGSATGWPRTEASRVLRSVLAQRPNHVPALVHLVRVAAQTESRDSVDALAHRVLALTPSPFHVLEVRGLVAWRNEDARGLNAVLGDIQIHPAFERLSWVQTLAATGYRPDDLVPIVHRVIRSDDSPADRLMARLTRVYLLAAAGRLQAAEREANDLRSLSAAYAVEMNAVLATLPFRRSDAERLSRARTALDRAVSLTDTVGRTSSDWERYFQTLPESQRQYLMGMTDVLMGRDSASNAAIALLSSTLGQPGSHSRYQPFSGQSGGTWLGRIIYGAYFLFLRGRHEDAIVVLRPMPREIMTTYPQLRHHPLALERYVRAEALRGSPGWQSRALEWYATFPDASVYDLPYLAPSHLRRAELFEQLGERDSAAVHYSRVIDLWQHADAELQTSVESAQRGLARTRKAAK